MDQNKLYQRFEIGIDRNRWKGIWQLQTSESNLMHYLPEVESPLYLYVSQYMHDIYCKDVIIIM